MHKNTLAIGEVSIGKHALCFFVLLFLLLLWDLGEKILLPWSDMFSLIFLMSFSTNIVSSLCPNRETQLFSNFEMNNCEHKQLNEIVETIIYASFPCRF